MNKITALRKNFSEAEITSFAVFNPANITYFSSFQGAVAILIPSTGKSTLYVSSVNYEQAKAEAEAFQIELLKRGENIFETLSSQVGGEKGKLAVDSLGVESWRSLAKALGGEDKLLLGGKMVWEQRKVKDAQEILSIRQACKLADIGMHVASQTVVPGVSEQDVAAEVEYAMRTHGSQGTSFDTIIASGAKSAFPHGGCTSRTISEGDLVIADLGATVDFYRSDMTRTFIAGKPSAKQKKIYETVKAAHEKAFSQIKPAVPAKNVDSAARQTIEDAGFGQFFVHNLGHGVGLEIHEPPTLSPDSKDVLAAGNVVTDEPGIYIPGFGGVRIEDTVLITKDGAEKLTSAPYLLENKK
jgi:Xaa-Pro dipeptidase